MRKGFTLIELAIALMVIGLILAMAMKGRTVIRAAEIKSDINNINKITAAISIYESKYGKLPGSDGAPGSNSYPNGAQSESVAAFYHDLMSEGLIKESDFYISMENAYIGLIGCTPTATGFNAEQGIYQDIDGTYYNNVCMYMTKTAPSENKLYSHATGPSITTPTYACYVEMYLDNRNLGSGNGKLKQNGAGLTFPKDTNCETDATAISHANQQRYYYAVF